MKLLWIAVVTLVLSLTTQRTNAQCNVATSATQVYDTAVSGSGNDLHTISFPRFDAALGTLLDVTISTTVNLTYDFLLENLGNDG